MIQSQHIHALFQSYAHVPPRTKYIVFTLNLYQLQVCAKSWFSERPLKRKLCLVQNVTLRPEASAQSDSIREKAAFFLLRVDDSFKHKFLFYL